jgi:hypothetical protein
MTLRTPGEILDAVATRQRYVTPLEEHMPLSPAMARACARVAYADAARLLAWAGTDPERLRQAGAQLLEMAARAR